MDDAGLAIASRVSARTTLSASSQFARTVYNVAGSDPGRTLSGQAKLGRQLNARLLLDLQGDVSNTSGGYTGQPHANLQNLAVVSTLTVTRVVAQLGLGVTRVSSSETSTGTGALSTGIGTAAIGPSATASVSRRSDRGFLTVFGERRALPTFGREAFLFNNAVGVSAARTLTASAGISGSAQTARSQTTLGQRQRFASTSAELTYRQRIFYGVSLNTTAFLRQRQNNGTFQDTGVALTASVPLR